VFVGGVVTAILIFCLPKASPETDSLPYVSNESLGPSPPIGPRTGQRAPDFTLRSLSGESVSLSDYLGRVVILDFWASWCIPCRTSMPTLHALWREYESRGVVFLGVNLDRSGTEARSYLERNGFSDMIVLWQSLNAAQAVALMFGVSGIPHTLLVDRSGIIRFSNHPLLLTRQLLDTYL
jgi:peroxiredoxin